MDVAVIAGVWDMPIEARWQLYHKWSSNHHEALISDLMALLASHDTHAAHLKVCIQHGLIDTANSAHITPELPCLRCNKMP